MSSYVVKAPIHPLVRNALAPASGHGRYWKRAAKSIRLVRQGCTNRPFFQIVVQMRRQDQYQPVIEQVGTWDPVPNKYNQQMVSLNYERIRHWLGSGAHLSRPVAEVLGIAGFLPIYPKTYMSAWRNRQRKPEVEAEAVESEAIEETPSS